MLAGNYCINEIKPILKTTYSLKYGFLQNRNHCVNIRS